MCENREFWLKIQNPVSDSFSLKEATMHETVRSLKKNVLMWRGLKRNEILCYFLMQIKTEFELNSRLKRPF